MEKHLIEVENLKWQIEYERKLQTDMNKMLEDKVSNLMATKNENQFEIKSLEKRIDELVTEKTQLTEKIEILEDIVSKRNSEIVDLKNRIDDLET